MEIIITLLVVFAVLYIVYKQDTYEREEVRKAYENLQYWKERFAILDKKHAEIMKEHERIMKL